MTDETARQEIAAGTDVRMEVQRACSYLEAVIRVKPLSLWERDASDWPFEREVEVTLVHELLHIALHDVEAQHRAVRGLLHADAWALHNDAFQRCLEGATERLARLLVAERHGLDPLTGAPAR